MNIEIYRKYMTAEMLMGPNSLRIVVKPSNIVRYIHEQTYLYNAQVRFMAR